MKDVSLTEEFARTFKRFMDAMVVEASREPSPFLARLREHLGIDPSRLPVIAEEFQRYDHPNLQTALDAYVAAPGRSAEIIGVAAQNKRFMAVQLSDLFSGGPYGRLSEGPVDYVNFRLEDDRVLPCVQFGLYLIHAGADRIAAFVSGPPSEQMDPRVRLRLEVIAPRREAAQAMLKEITAAMRERNVYRGKVISLVPPGQFGAQALVRFHHLPAITADAIVLPPGILERVERQTTLFSAHAASLVAAGRSLKRGMLLYGPPGTGKTLTVMYLATGMSGRTVILTTGVGLAMIGTIAQFARDLTPATVIVEDVDLIAQERGLPGVQTQPLLFELLNQMDGLADDADVLFILTTNRPDILEPALAARPGRVDLVVELPLPDADARHRLLELYARGLELAGVDLAKYVDRTDGASPAYIKELLRKASLQAALDGGDARRVREEHLDRAMADLAEGGELAKRIVGFGTSAYLPPAPSVGPMRPAGFPEMSETVRRIAG